MLSAEQLEARRSWIGASDVPAILGLSPYATAYDIWLHKVHGVYSGAGEAAHLGDIYERPILDWYEREAGVQLVRGHSVSVDGQRYPLRVSLDALQLDIGNGLPVNAKTSGLRSGVPDAYGEPGTDEVPEHVRIQEWMEALACGAEYAIVPAMIVRRGLCVFRVPRADAETYAAIHDELSRFWIDHVLTKSPPEIGERAPSADLLKALRREPDRLCDLDSDALRLVNEWESSKEVAAKESGRAEECKAKIIALLGTSECGRLPDGRLFTFRETVQQVKEQPAHERRFRVARIKKGDRT